MRRHNGHIAGQKDALQPPIWEPEGGRLAIMVTCRDKRPPSSPMMEPESGPAVVVKFAICRGVRSRQ